LVFVADEQDNVYAFDAAANTKVWSTNVATSVLGSYVDCSVGVYASTFPPCESNTPDGNTVGIMGTPVIDESDGILYAAGAVSLNGNPAFYIFAIGVETGNVIASAQIQGFVQGSNPGPMAKCSSTYPSNNTLVFDSGHVQRAALLLLDHVVYIAFAPGDHEWENGWLFGYSQASGSFTPTAVFATTPYGTGGGVWGSSAGPASDGNYIYTVSGNGTFDVASNGDPWTGVIALSSSSRHLPMARLFR
jgi:outer membrane protein assembly factor BamB